MQMLEKCNSATLSQEERASNEARLQGMVEQDFLGVIQALVMIVVAPNDYTENSPEYNNLNQVRKLASIIFKNSIIKLNVSKINTCHVILIYCFVHRLTQTNQDG